MSDQAVIHWTEANIEFKARWRSEKGLPAPKRVVITDELMTADNAYRLACEGTALLWRGDFQNARQMLLAMARRADHKKRKAPKSAPAIPLTEAFHMHRLAQSQRARTLGLLLLPLAADFSVPLRRAPDVRFACIEAYGSRGGDDSTEESIVSLRELLGLIGAHEWRKKGVEVPALGARIHPHYGVFAPIRGEYVALIAEAPLPLAALLKAGGKSLPLAFDIGTGTGVLAAVLARRGVECVIATDTDSRALVCAAENIGRLKLEGQVQIVKADLFPTGRAPLIVCNPPWIPARPSSPIEGAIYDPDNHMLRGFLNGLTAHLEPGGEGWLILSDIAEHLGLRSRAQLLDYIEKGGLKVIDRLDVRPTHRRAADITDPLHVARAAEVTSLWRLGLS